MEPGGFTNCGLRQTILHTFDRQVFRSPSWVVEYRSQELNPCNCTKILTTLVPRTCQARCGTGSSAR